MSEFNDFPVCPICGEEGETFYYDKYGEPAGCDLCIIVR